MPKVLLVEDEEDARRMLEIGLIRSGHDVVACRNGVDACAVLDASFDAVVTDLLMPQMDGIGLLRAMAQQEHRAARIIITSFAEKDLVIEALNLGAHYLIEKPFKVATLVQAIARILPGAQGPIAVEQVFQRQLAALPINERERMLIIYVLKGLPNTEVAALLKVSEQAVKSALFALYRKLGIGSRGELFHLIFPI